MIFLGVEGVVRFKVTGIEMNDRFAHVAVEVGCLNVTAQRVRIGEKEFTVVLYVGFR